MSSVEHPGRSVVTGLDEDGIRTGHSGGRERGRGDQRRFGRHDAFEDQTAVVAQERAGGAEAVVDRIDPGEVEDGVERAIGESETKRGIESFEGDVDGAHVADHVAKVRERWCAFDHLGRRVDPHHLDPGTGDGCRESAGADTQLEYGPVVGQFEQRSHGAVGVERVGVPVVVDVGERASVAIGSVGIHRWSLPADGRVARRYPCPVTAYLDHAATGPMRPEAVEAMLPFLTERYANPSGAHREARDARRAIDEARDELAALIGSRPGEIVFTSGGTEADNLAVFGLGDGDGIAVCSAIEHHAVLDPVEMLGGATVAVDARGTIRADDLAAVLDRDPVRVVSLMAVNNEIGAIQPIGSLAAVVREHAPGAALHTDAVQAFCWTDVAAHCAAVDSLSLSAHKFGGPKGVGLLMVRDGVAVRARQLGGGQERERRSGTQNVAGIVAMAVAARLTAAERDRELVRIRALRDRLLDGLLDSIPDTVETGGADRSDRVAGIAHVCFRAVESEALLFLLERGELAASAASSCSSGAVQTSHVLSAMGVDADLARGSLRLSLGHTTTDADIDLALEVIPPAVARLREFGI